MKNSAEILKEANWQCAQNLPNLGFINSARITPGQKPSVNILKKIITKWTGLKLPGK